MIQDLALILIVAAIVTLLFKKLKQPVVLGYIVAGFLVSDKMPYMPSVADSGHSVEQWSEIGVMFLMFCLGLEFSVRKILKQGMAPVKAALITISVMVLLGIGVGKMFGWTDMNCLFLGGMLAMSSTTIIYKAFDDLHLHQQKFASMVMSVLILEDIFGIVMMVVLQTIAGGSMEGGSIISSLLSIVLFLVISFAVGLYFIPTVLKRIRKLASAETLLIVSLGLCCTMAFISTKLGFSAALGAFLMGSVLSETAEVEKINRVVEPVKNLFGAIFFVSVGMLVDPAILVDYALPIIALVLAILIGQAVFGSLGYFISGETLKSSMRCGFSMAQIGEFSFIIAGVGLTLGVISTFLYPVVVAVSVITTFITPYMIRAAEPAYNLLEKLLSERVLNWANNRTAGNSFLERNKFFAAITRKVKGKVARSANRFYLQTKINAGSLPRNAYKLMNRDIHISTFTVPEDSRWMGRTLLEMQLGTIFNVHVSSILRGNRRINIPKASEIILPGDRLQVIGTDEDLEPFSKALASAVYETNDATEDEEMVLKKIVIGEGSIFLDKNLIELNLRERFHTMVVGLERGEKKLSVIEPDYKFQKNDIIWIVTEKEKAQLF
ncbi:MAG: cation:proton antiporter [Bacteroidaceae bacterium]|nr:cation:proton antiporter [Bacteroidaceae bacterium]